MSPILRNVVPDAYQNINPSTLAETVGFPPQGRGSGGDVSPKRVNYKIKVDLNGNPIFDGCRDRPYDHS